MSQLLANIHPNAKIGKDVTIEPFATIQGDVEIGDGSWIGPNTVIMDGARIGKNCKIFPGAVISAVPQDLKFDGEITTAWIGDNSIIRECVTVSRGTTDKYKTVIGDSCLIMAYAHVAHDCIIGDHCIIVNSVQLGGHVEIDDWTVIGGTSAVHQFVKIGKHVMISGQSMVRKDVPPFTKAGRNPVSYVGINSIGLRRRGYQNEQINQIQDIYRVLYLKGNNNTQALEYIELEMAPSAERDEILNFIKRSTRGIMKGY